MTALTSPDRISDDALASGVPAGEGGFDPSKPFRMRDGNAVEVFTAYATGNLPGFVEGWPRAWLPDGRHVSGRRELDLINTPIPAAPQPSVDAVAVEGPLRRLRQALAVARHVESLSLTLRVDDADLILAALRARQQFTGARS